MSLSRHTKNLAYRLSERHHDRRRGIVTRGVLSLEELGLPQADFQAYSPTPYSAFARVMRALSVRMNDTTFVDFGSGMGRAVILAGELPFRRVIGVELSERMVAAARENLRRARLRLRCSRVEVVRKDATEFELPEDASVLHLFNPFRGEPLEAVFARIRASHRRHPRRMDIVFGNPEFFDPLAASWDRIERTTDVPWPYFDHSRALSNMYRVYHVAGTAD